MEYVYGIIGAVLGAGVTFALLKFLGGKPTVQSPVVTPAPLPPPPPAKPTAEGVRVLALLQAEARLVDFLLEDISGATNEQVGSAVREIHRKSKAVIEQHFTLEAILPQTEGSQVTVPTGFDPSRIRVQGNVTGSPPFTGTLNHPGWRVKDMKLSAPAAGTDVMVIQPAEVQID